MSLNLGQIPPLTMELAALERLKNRRHHFFSVAIDPILFILAGNSVVSSLIWLKFELIQALMNVLVT